MEAAGKPARGWNHRRSNFDGIDVKYERANLVVVGERVQRSIMALAGATALLYQGRLASDVD